MKKIDEFILKDGRVVSIVLPSMDGLQAITDFINKLSKEDTFLSFAGEKYSIDFEKNWLQNALNEIKFKKNYILWTVYDGQIIGSVDIHRGGNRDPHVGKISLMVDADYRNQGLGKYLFQKILDEGKKIKLKILNLNVFGDNIPAISLYRKFGFKEWGRLPNGFIRKGKYSDFVKMYKNLN